MEKIVQKLSPEQCARIGLIKVPGPWSDTAALKAKADYLESENFRNLQWGGESEIELLSLFLKGKFRIVVIDPENRNGHQYSYSPNLELLYQRPSIVQRLPNNRLYPAKEEIVLLHGPYHGNGSRIHFDLIEFVHGKRKTEPTLKINPSETNAERHERYMSYVQFCEIYVKQSRAEAAKGSRLDSCLAQEMVRELQLKEDERIVRELQIEQEIFRETSNKRWSGVSGGKRKGDPPMSPRAGPLTHPSRTAVNLPAPSASSASAIQQQSVEASPAPSTTATNYAWYQKRSKMWRQIPFNSRAHFLNLVKPIFVEYLRRSSKGLHNQCADIINILLDLPAKSLSKSGGARKLQQRLEKYVPIHDQILQSIMEGAHEETCQPPSEDTKKNQASGMGGQETENIMDRNEAKAVKQKRAAVPQKEEHIEEEKEAPPLDLLTRLVRRAISIIREGGPRAWSRAAKVLSQTGSASIRKKDKLFEVVWITGSSGCVSIRWTPSGLSP
jgi:hypothetical protein